MENPIKMDDLGAHPYFLETPICCLAKLFKDNTTPAFQAPEVPRGTPKEVLRILSSVTRCWTESPFVAGVVKLRMEFYKDMHMWAPRHIYDY